MATGEPPRFLPVLSTAIQPQPKHTSMIELDHDQLRFSFPEVSRQLRALVERHVAAHLPAVLAADPKATLEKLFQKQWRAYTRNQSFREQAADRSLAGAHEAGQDDPS